MSERRTQPTCKCKQPCDPLLGNIKSNDGNSNRDNHHGVPGPIAAPVQLRAFPSKIRIQWLTGSQSSAWTQLDQEPLTVLMMDLKGSTVKHLSAFCEIVYSLCLEKSGEKDERCLEATKLTPNQERPLERQAAAAAAETPAVGSITAGEDRDTGIAWWHQARNLSPLPSWTLQESINLC